MKWFKHDSNAQSDAKLEKLRIRYGMEGYGLYWYCLELIVGNIEAHNITFELEHDADILSHRTGIHADQVQEVMKYMIELGLFENHKGNVTCFKLVKRLDTSMTSNPELRKIIKKFHESHDLVMIESGGSHDPVMPEEKRREEKRKSKPLTLIPKDFTLTDQMIKYARAKNVNSVEDLEAVTEGFIEHYNGEETKRRDWYCAWQKWLKNAIAWGHLQVDIEDGEFEDGI